MMIRDVREIGKLAALTLFAWSLPPRLWRKAAIATSAIGKPDGCWPAYRRVLGHQYSAADIAEISNRRRAYMRELKFQILGLNGPWRSWRPNIRLKGATHLRKALARRRGVILWVTECAFSTLIVKMALHAAGHQACQLSRPGHGFSPTAFAARYLNPLWTRIEDRFIAERILITELTSADAMAVMRERLNANQVVIITVGWQAHRLADVPFFNDRVRLPTGPIRLARATGASLLPVFTVANDDGGFEVSIEKPLYPARGGASDECIAAAYAKRLEPFLLNHPDQWKGWHSLMCQHGWNGAKDLKVADEMKRTPDH
jgi:lauroyl/myristoyl acyltransferase